MRKKIKDIEERFKKLKGVRLKPQKKEKSNDNQNFYNINDEEVQNRYFCISFHDLLAYIMQIMTASFRMKKSRAN